MGGADADGLVLMPMGYWGTQAAGRMDAVLLGAKLVVGAFVWTMIAYGVTTVARAGLETRRRRAPE